MRLTVKQKNLKIREAQNAVNRLTQRLGTCFLSEFDAVQKALFSARLELKAIKEEAS